MMITALQPKILETYRDNEKRVAWILVSIVILLSSAVRLIHVEADFPEGLTWSAAPYSDEGWYSNAAISFHLRGQLLLEGDFNPVVNLPILQLVQAVMFKAFGMSLATARLTIIGFFALMLTGVHILIRRFSTPTAGLIAIVLLSVNFHLFAFSRLAILEIPMTSLLVLSLAIALPSNRQSLGRAILAGFIFSLAVLTKTTAVFALPVLLYIAWDKRRTFRDKAIYILMMISIISATLVAHYAWANLTYPGDYNYFNSLNLEPRILLTSQGIFKNLVRAIWHGIVIGPVLYTFTALLFPIFLLSSGSFRHNRLVIACSLWIAAYILILSIRGYLPPRYYVALGLPVIMLISVMAVDRPRPWRLSLLLPIVLVFIASMNFVQIVDYLRSPQFTLVETAEDIRSQMEQPGGMLMGGMANTISLAAGIPSINSKMGTSTLQWRIVQYSPTHYVSVGLDHETVELVKEMGDLELLATYDAFGNYYGGRRVHFYRIIRDSDGT
jgi:hypothetical protein